MNKVKIKKAPGGNQKLSRTFRKDSTLIITKIGGNMKITIDTSDVKTTADLNNLMIKVKKEVAESIEVNDPKSIFKGTAFNWDDLRDINSKYPIVKEEAILMNKSDGWYTYTHPFVFLSNINKVYKKNSFGRKCFKTVSHVDIHDSLRKMTLAAFGVKLNNEINERDYPEAELAYEEFKALFFEIYERRLKKASGLE